MHLVLLMDSTKITALWNKSHFIKVITYALEYKKTQIHDLNPEYCTDFSS